LAKESEFRDRLFYGKLPILDIDFGVKFDVVICIAVIMHLKIEEIKEWVKDIKNYLADGGKVILSYSTTPRVRDDRFFEDLNGKVVNNIFLNNGFRLVEESCSFDALGRGIEWRSRVYKILI
jgi:2-polyprenyl-3-methyl-5-hydroxy-6-metoxy-1,4-benzoquinol methylase